MSSSLQRVMTLLDNISRDVIPYDYKDVGQSNTELGLSDDATELDRHLEKHRLILNNLQMLTGSSMAWGSAAYYMSEYMSNFSYNALTDFSEHKDITKLLNLSELKNLVKLKSTSEFQYRIRMLLTCTPIYQQIINSCFTNPDKSRAVYSLTREHLIESLRFNNIYDAILDTIVTLINDYLHAADVINTTESPFTIESLVCSQLVNTCLPVWIELFPEELKPFYNYIGLPDGVYTLSAVWYGSQIQRVYHAYGDAMPTNLGLNFNRTMSSVDANIVKCCVDNRFKRRMLDELYLKVIAIKTSHKKGNGIDSNNYRLILNLITNLLLTDKDYHFMQYDSDVGDYVVLCQLSPKERNMLAQHIVDLYNTIDGVTIRNVNNELNDKEPKIGELNE